MAYVTIGDRRIGEGYPPFIVAEVGINHNGQLEKAYEMIHVAKEAGVDAVKFQTFKAEEFVGDADLMFTYRSQGQEVTESMLAMFKRYEFSKDEWLQIKNKCDEEEILFLSTPQNRSDLDLLLEIGIPAIKIGSDDFTNLPLMRSYSSTGLPLIVSCGMADLAEVYTSLKTIGSLEEYPTILLLCTSQYPTPASDVNLKKLATLSRNFPMVPIGFSDHTQGVLAASIATAFGACFFEKHFTLDQDLPGPDHWFSEDPVSLKQWVTSIRAAYQMLGSAMIKPTTEELKMRVLARRSIVALRDIPEGEVFSEQNLGLRRPGNGLPPSLYENVLSLKATKNIQRGSLIHLGDFT
ncbi:N-acetylneuraminate synthase family protein [Paenibacillus frigoriresistens]|uniref:N-acetylneuraminate synthase family protein n=1 Tax=Paenibacillus alginolyticus TaxID=59839 RepID=UPI001565E670|nr:N-acetylneuraminate synthase family protein [Paenibacillus frigoriresistens]NRF93666.1 N-acetylneuraminate synthase family protein [Paenibacillus frigoriresistens]